MIKFKQKQVERDSEAGFTLLEVIAAVSILTVGLLAVASMQTAAIQSNDKAYRVTEGTTWAQNRLEYLMALPYDDPLLSIEPDEKADPTSTPQVPDGYTITYNVEGMPPFENIKLITVFATRQDRGATKIRQLTSIKNNL
jgi:prepilin-type N-terminal cleavage/methylation domain-containing protein